MTFKNSILCGTSAAHAYFFSQTAVFVNTDLLKTPILQWTTSFTGHPRWALRFRRLWMKWCT